MSDQARVLSRAAKAVAIFAMAILFGPWIVMILLAWMLEPRAGAWGLWPHAVGIGWLVFLISWLVYSRIRG